MLSRQKLNDIERALERRLTLVFGNHTVKISIMFVAARTTRVIHMTLGHAPDGLQASVEITDLSKALEDPGEIAGRLVMAILPTLKKEMGREHHRGEIFNRDETLTDQGWVDSHMLEPMSIAWSREAAERLNQRIRVALEEGRITVPDDLNEARRGLEPNHMIDPTDTMRAELAELEAAVELEEVLGTDTWGQF